MSQSLIIKDGNGEVKSLQVDSSSYGYISNHAVVSTATTSTITKYYTNGPDGWEWDIASGVVEVAAYDKDRKSLIINNNTSVGKCYVLVGSSDFGTITDVTIAPPIYSFLLDFKGVYFADTTSAVLQHAIYVPSSSNISDASSMTISVTEVK